MIAEFSRGGLFRSVLMVLSGLIVWSTTGCSSYHTPSPGAQMDLFAAASRDQLTDGAVASTLAKKPLATLPCSIAIVRVQSPGYQSNTATGWGHGAYSIVLQNDIDGMDAKLDSLNGKLPKVTGIAPLNRLLLPEDLKSDLELRKAAAALHADMLLIYTLDTDFYVEDVAAPVTVVTLGLSPNQIVRVGCTASSVLLDTRNGYVYGVAQSTEKQLQLASGWTNTAAIDQTRRRVESKAFEKLVDEFKVTWDGVAKTLTASPSASAVRE